MAEKLISLKKRSGSSGGGGTMTETVLWTNDDPTAVMYASANIILSQAYTDFSYLKIKYKNRINTNVESSVIIPVSDFSQLRLSGNSTIAGALSARRSDGLVSYRRFASDSSDATKFVIDSGTVLSNNSYLSDGACCIILEIIGLN